MPHFEATNALLNTRFKLISDKLEQSIQAKNYVAIVMLHERPHRLDAFVKYVIDYVTPSEYWRLLGEIYTDSENIRQNYNAWEELLFTHAPAIKPKSFMPEEDYRAFKKLPAKLRVYRGVQSEFWQGFSWTLNEDKAKWFASRYSSKTGLVTVGTIKKSKVLGYFNGRGEEEIVCHFDDVVIANQFNV